MKTYIMGDIHGQYDRTIAILQQARLIDEEDTWSGGESLLWFLGDLVDRGPNGVGVIDLVMKLQSQAAAVGGKVGCLIGNHEVQMLAAQRFPRPSGYFVTSWRRNGGHDSDMVRLTPRHLNWLRNLPAVTRVGERLLIHADSSLYLNYSPTIDGVNIVIKSILNGTNEGDWEDLISDFSEHRVFANMRHGEQQLRDYLRYYGGEQLVHGHTPIPVMADVIAPDSPFFYLDKRCVNVDGGMAMGAPGFIWKL